MDLDPKLQLDFQGVVIGPEDRLLVRVIGDAPHDLFERLADALNEIGLGERALVVTGNIEFVKVAG